MTKPKTTRNRNPEKFFIRLDLLPALTRAGIDWDIIESKAVFSAKLGRYLRGQTTPGMSDIIGNLSCGTACYIEAKAPGKRSTIRPDQRVFLQRKINSFAFAVVVDNSQLFETILKVWLSLREKSKEEARDYLLKQLPG